MWCSDECTHLFSIGLLIINYFTALSIQQTQQEIRRLLKEAETSQHNADSKGKHTKSPHPQGSYTEYCRCCDVKLSVVMCSCTCITIMMFTM